MEEILSGVSEIDTGTREVMNALTRIVDDANTNTLLAEGVAGEIIQQNSALQNISNGTEELQSKVSSLEGLLANIKDAISEIDSNASANELVAAKISGALS
jgi:archaellum component FlaC